MKILFDTNFLMLPFTRRVDVFAEAQRVSNERVELFVLRSSMAELGNVKGKDRLPARAALVYLERNLNNVEMVNGVGKPDLQIIEFAQRNKGCAIATLDASLRRKAKHAGARMLTLRGGTHLELE